jgi:hypothetical protein
MCDESYGGVWWMSEFRWQESGFSLHEDIFTFNLLQRFYKCTFNAVCEDDAAINCTVVHYKES